MDSLTSINQAVSQQNQQSQAQAQAQQSSPEAQAQDPAAQSQPEKGPKSTQVKLSDLKKARAQTANTAATTTTAEVVDDSNKKPEDVRKAARKEKLTGLQRLASEQQKAFVEGQQARQVRQQAEGELTRMRAEADAAKQRLDAAMKDPFAWLESNGLKMRDLAARLAKGESPNDALKALQDKLIDIETKNESLKQELLQKEMKASQTLAYETAKKALIDSFDNGTEKYPTLHKVIKSPNQLVKEFLGVVEEIKANPATAAFADQYSDEEVLEALEAQWADRALALGAVAKPELAADKTKKPALQVVRPALTTAGASQGTALPADFKKLPAKEQTKILADIYRANRAK